MTSAARIQASLGLIGARHGHLPFVPTTNSASAASALTCINRRQGLSAMSGALMQINAHLADAAQDRGLF
jgi:hypothetical protein